jgi:hypothetical protein
MRNLEPAAHSFIVRIRVDERRAETGRAAWHGEIIHEPGGERRPLRNLDEIPLFIAPYLEAAGVGLGLCAWLRRRWQR